MLYKATGSLLSGQKFWWRACIGCHDSVASVVFATGSYFQPYVLLFTAGAQTSDDEEREHSDQKAETQDSQE